MKNNQENFKSQHYQFVDKKVVTELTSLSGYTLKRYRLQGKLQQDIHWVMLNSRVVRYNIILILDWMQNYTNNPQAHLRAIENYLASLPSSQKKIRRNSSQ
jgi:hypothetical protein